ncbi:methyltransferase, FkbM family [Frankia torreyi]|uniref:Methyltransferase, FkbM family n=2 Tax=Frankia TaxID=1854 RepID=A0A0D8B9U4_9ACTN|nr:FkbM family methyltransferase [Frankia sp. ACN1ag]KJE21048.1 methyltransferase, FkbM family [Frankia torreyi]KQC39637.1 methyltransferase FkbM [Frankia sp. ACN1ag]
MDPRVEKQLAQVRRKAVDLGLGPALKLVRDTVVPTARRNRNDDRHLALLLSFVLRENSNCIDVGAHRGDVLRTILQHAPRGRHIAYEPLPHMAASLTTDFPTVQVRQAALSDKPGVLPFTYVRSRPAYSGLRDRVPDTEDVEQIEVAVEVLDEALPTDYLPTLIKVDVEGAEYGVFRGARKLIAASRPHLVFEFGAGARDYGTTADEMYELVDSDLGLRIFDLDGDGPYTLPKFRDTFETGRHFNFVAHP